MTREWRGGEMRGWLKQKSDLSAAWVWCHSHTEGNARVSTYYQVLDRHHERMYLHDRDGGERGRKKEKGLERIMLIS